MRKYFVIIEIQIESHFCCRLGFLEDEATKETWRNVGEKELEAFKSGPFSEWGFGAGEIVKSTTSITKVCFLAGKLRNC